MSAAPKLKDQTVTVSCPNCRRTVQAVKGADRASCGFCGCQWPWTKLGLVMGKRGIR